MLGNLLKFARVAPFIPIYLAAFFVSLHYAAILYVNSTYLARFFDSAIVSILFVLAALLNVLFFILAPRLLSRFGLRALYFIFILIAGGSLAGLAFSNTAPLVGTFFVLYLGVLFMIYYCLDIFLENISVDTKTGGIRGLYLTLMASAVALGPLLLTLFIDGDYLLPVYIAALVLLVPVFLTGFWLKYRRGPGSAIWSSYTGILPLAAWWRADSIRRATIARFVLETFYALMIIFVPVYLHTYLGFSWASLGIIFTVMLLPFVFLEWPMGEIADRFLGEKEIMSVGLFITGASLLVMPFLGFTFFGWMAILFISRIGASFIEVSTESHFFKHVDSRDSALISVFRLARPAGLIFGAAVGALSLLLLPFGQIFFIFALIAFFGLKESLHLKDTL